MTAELESAICPSYCGLEDEPATAFSKAPSCTVGYGVVGCASLEDISTSTPLSLALLPAAIQGSLKVLACGGSVPFSVVSSVRGLGLFKASLPHFHCSLGFSLDLTRDCHDRL